ncbi:MAG: SpoIID/LytB domain-containing protein, partial [Acidimicrobiales bacterium]
MADIIQRHSGVRTRWSKIRHDIIGNALPVLNLPIRLTILVTFAAASMGLSASNSTALATTYPYADVSLTGHGWGPGIGMGQWGAFGYAISGWSYQQILIHFYGSTAAGQTSLGALSVNQSSTNIRVAITENDGNPVAVSSGSSFYAAGVQMKAGDSAKLVPGGNGEWSLYEGQGCSGPWSAAPSKTGLSNPTITPSAATSLGASNASTYALTICLGTGNMLVQGNIVATYNASGNPRTVNVLPLEEYVAGVVPNESPAYWGTLGAPGAQNEPRGYQELEAQAVAARSYVMANLGSGINGNYADICDTYCQVYRGLANQTPLVAKAVQNTAGQVIFMPDGQVADTQYSSSTGGWTAPSTFNAVADTGDSVCIPQACNPHHTWNTQVPVSAVEQAYSSIGTLVSITATKRNGLGSLGGRVLGLQITGTTGTVNTTGSAFASQFSSYGVQSNWFEVDGQPSGGVSGYWLVGADGAVYPFGNAKYYGSLPGIRIKPPAPVV